MAQILDAAEVIAELSSALAKLAEKVHKEGTSSSSSSAAARKKKGGASSSEPVADAAAVGAMERLTTSAHAKARRRSADRSDASKEMSDVTNNLNARLRAMPVPDWCDNTSVDALTALTASNRRLATLSSERSYTSGLSAERYALIAQAAFELIRDVADYVRAVAISQMEQVRAQNFTADMGVDTRPASRSVEAAARGAAGAYGDGAGDDDDDDDAASRAMGVRVGVFDESELDSLNHSEMSLYATPASSAAVTPVVSRPGSPPVEPDLMGRM